MKQFSASVIFILRNAENCERQETCPSRQILNNRSLWTGHGFSVKNSVFQTEQLDMRVSGKNILKISVGKSQNLTLWSSPQVISTNFNQYEV